MFYKASEITSEYKNPEAWLKAYREKRVWGESDRSTQHCKNEHSGSGGYHGNARNTDHGAGRRKRGASV